MRLLVWCVLDACVAAADWHENGATAGLLYIGASVLLVAALYWQPWRKS